MTDLSQLAKSLTKAQREAVLLAMFGYFDPNTVKSLRRRGLASACKLTELGEALRAHLKGQSDEG